MHEMSVAESMLDVISEALGGRVEILSATIRLGPLAGIDPASLQFCFTEVAEQLGFGTPGLIVNQVPAKARCTECSRTYDLFRPYERCPDCHSMARQVSGGDDFEIDTVDVAEATHDDTER